MTKSAWIAKIGWAFAARRCKELILGEVYRVFKRSFVLQKCATCGFTNHIRSTVPQRG